MHTVSLSTTFRVETDTVGTVLEKWWYDLFPNGSSDGKSHVLVLHILACGISLFEEWLVTHLCRWHQAQPRNLLLPCPGA